LKNRRNLEAAVLFTCSAILNSEAKVSTSDLRKRKQLPASEIIAGYRQGVGMTSLAQQWRCTPNTIRRILARHGVGIRSHSEANRVRREVEHSERSFVRP
jgi:hypothetical protein